MNHLELKDSNNKNTRKRYLKPEINMIRLDNTISIIMMTVQNPGKPPPWTPPGGGGKGDDPFESPFDDKPFG